MTGTMKITRSDSKKTPDKIIRIEADNAFVFLAQPKKNSIYLNLGGRRFNFTSETPITWVEKKVKP